MDMEKNNKISSNDLIAIPDANSKTALEGKRVVNDFFKKRMRNRIQLAKESPSTFSYHVFKSKPDNKWIVKKVPSLRASASCNTKRAAIQLAKKLANGREVILFDK